MGRVGVRAGAPVVALALALGTGCSIQPRPIEYDSLGGAPATADGLHRVRTFAVGAAYLKPGARFSSYDGVVIDPVTVSYKNEPRRPTEMNRRRGNFALSEAAMDRLKRIFEESFERELARSEHFAVGAEAGSSVLRLSGRIVNLVVNVPPTRGREADFVQNAGEMTLILVMRDSQTGELLGRVADRRAIRPGSAGLSMVWESGSVRNWGAVRDVFSNWARILRHALDDLREVPHVPGG